MRTDVGSLVKRVPGSIDFIRIDSAKCTMCGRCLVVCTMNLWRKKGGKVSLAADYKERCVECAACYQVCEADAIEFRYPSGGTGIVCEYG